MSSELPLAGQPAPERADAARNRRLVLARAEELVAAHGVHRLTMNAVAAAAGVGVGTVYRRFGDLAGLVEAMMNERERLLQEAFLAGPPPLGPGAEPLDRVRAFLRAYVDLLDTYGELLAAAETGSPGVRYRGAYLTHHRHLVTQLEAARPDLDAEYLADTLLAALRAGHVVHQRRGRGMDAERIKAGLDALVAGIAAAPRSATP